jgi:hypothetical protein
VSERINLATPVPRANGAGAVTVLKAGARDTSKDVGVDPSLVSMLGADELFVPQPDANFVVAALGMAPGPPTAFFGQGYVGKTIFAMSLGLSVASGKPAWGVHRVREGRVLHLDHEQGRRVTSKRFQRLARAMGLGPEELRGLWESAIYPRVNLTTPGAEDIYTRLFEGKVLVILDALKALTPGVDENSSEIRDYMGILSRASEATGATCLLIHHAGKTPAAGAPKPRKEMGRGSSGIFDECGNVFVLTGEKGAPALVTHEKERELEGRTLPNFGLRIIDVQVGDDPASGLAVEHLEGEQLARLGAKTKEASEKKAVVVGAEAIRTFFRKLEGRAFEGSKTELRDAVRIGKGPFSTALSQLMADGELVRDGTYHDGRYRLTAGGRST